MKTEFNNANKDNVTIGTILAAGLFALASGLVTSQSAGANRATDVAVQKMSAVVVTAQRAPVATLDAIIVTAPRKISHV